MIKKLSSIITTCVCATFVGASTFISPVTYADDVCSPQSGVPDSVKDAAGCNNNTNPNALKNTVVEILNNIILVLGIVAVVFIIIGGINYMTSMGDAGKAKKARDTILYAVIGLIICVLAYAIVNFVIINILNQKTSP